jgi:vacuole morphology and inheritance protein 14
MVSILLSSLNDQSEEVVKRDLELLAQISQSSDDKYFTDFMFNLLLLFSTDRRLLESRGSLIIRQLSFSLDPERIFRTFAELLEKDEDLEFASIMVQNLNAILITAPELSDLRKNLKILKSPNEVNLFKTLYRSWCHNPVALLSLCLLASAYEHAADLLPIFADLEMNVALLIQIDKLVQLIESPVFTYLRLQLLEPVKYHHLFKCLYGILMLLPQSSAFSTLRNRLNSVNALATLYATPGVLSTSPPQKRYLTIFLNCAVS